MLLAFPLFGRGECPVIAIQSRQQRVIMRRNRKHTVLKRQLCTIVQPCTGENIFLIPSSGSEKRSPPRSTAANTDSDRSRRPLFGKDTSALSVEKGHRRPRGENAREFAAHLAERSRKTAPLRRKGLRSFDCDGSEKSANGLRARLLNVVLRPLSENRCPIPTEVPCRHFWHRLWCQKAVNAIGCNRRAAAD